MALAVILSICDQFINKNYAGVEFSPILPQILALVLDFKKSWKSCIGWIWRQWVFCTKINPSMPFLIDRSQSIEPYDRQSTRMTVFPSNIVLGCFDLGLVLISDFFSNFKVKTLRSVLSRSLANPTSKITQIHDTFLFLHDMIILCYTRQFLQLSWNIF